jgi:hypothetical protein
MNGEFSKLVATAMGDLAACVKDFAKSKPLTPPSFGPVADGSAVKTEGVESVGRLTGELFGDDLDPAVLTEVADSAGAKCQVAELKTFNKCKKSGLAGKSPPGAIADQASLESLFPAVAAGATAGTCVNANAGTTTCGTGSCQVTTATCTNGTPNTCVPGAPKTETCNNLDDNCNGTIDDEPFADGLEPNNSCANIRTLSTVYSDETRTIITRTLYPSGDIDLFKINAEASDSSCGCCALSFDEDYDLVITLTVPQGAGSYRPCAGSSCLPGGCVTGGAGGTGSLHLYLDGACPGNDAYTQYVSVERYSTPGYECLPYALSCFFNAGPCL